MAQFSRYPWLNMQHWSKKWQQVEFSFPSVMPQMCPNTFAVTISANCRFCSKKTKSQFILVQWACYLNHPVLFDWTSNPFPMLRALLLLIGTFPMTIVITGANGGKGGAHLWAVGTYDPLDTLSHIEAWNASSVLSYTKLIFICLSYTEKHINFCHYWTNDQNLLTLASVNTKFVFYSEKKKRIFFALCPICSRISSTDYSGMNMNNSLMIIVDDINLMAIIWLYIHSLMSELQA